MATNSLTQQTDQLLEEASEQIGAVQDLLADIIGRQQSSADEEEAIREKKEAERLRDQQASALPKVLAGTAIGPVAAIGGVLLLGYFFLKD